MRQYNDFERSKEMWRSTGESEYLDLSTSDRLRDSIEDYDPSIHQPVHLQIRPKRNRRIPTSPTLERPDMESAEESEE